MKAPPDGTSKCLTHLFANRLKSRSLSCFHTAVFFLDRLISLLYHAFRVNVYRFARNHPHTNAPRGVMSVRVASSAFLICSVVGTVNRRDGMVWRLPSDMSRMMTYLSRDSPAKERQRPTVPQKIAIIGKRLIAISSGKRDVRRFCHSHRALGSQGDA